MRVLSWYLAWLLVFTQYELVHAQSSTSSTAISPSTTQTRSLSLVAPCGSVIENQVLTLACPTLGGVILGVSFASYGTPNGSCASGFAASSCTSPMSVAVVTAACVGRQSCTVSAKNSNFGSDPCSGTIKSLAANVSCGGKSGRV